MITLAGYAVIVALMIACEAVARRTGRVATFGRVISALAGWRTTRLLVMAGWLWVGWHLFVRVGR